MFSFTTFLDLPLIWFALIILAIFLYVILDGFDLGVGILFPFAPSEKCRDRMMNSIAPFWDGNETWLVLGGGGLFAAFPLAYAVLMPALYIPVIVMLLGLAFRGVAFEFRFKAAGTTRKLWDWSFNVGSLVAAFCQGLFLGTCIQGIKVQGRSFAGSGFEWLSGFSIMTGLALVCGYALLGSTWLIMKTEDDTQQWARRCAKVFLVLVAAFMILVSLGTPLINPGIKQFWFSRPNILYLFPLPLFAAGILAFLWLDLRQGREYRPFFLSLGLFLMNYLGLGVSLWPWLVPYAITYRQAAAAPQSQALLLIGAAVCLPVILAYQAFSYFVFRGKTSDEGFY
jgi:cytochrome d ubiquinol oxidase subunit II|uniref:Cytochrome d ubiquinol oxidase subunit II n=1 Tax=Desulfobacca acetoxidans TaxID=60893 RepID=A0A7V6A314_9BACT